MLISLIMPTLGNLDYINLFLKSLIVQTYKEFELIIVDQSKGDEVKELSDRYTSQFKIIYVKSDKLGLSYNRNLGISVANGDILAYPDDDCEYECDTIEKVVDFFKNNEEYTIYSCSTITKDKTSAFKRMYQGNCEITYENVLDTVLSITFFVYFKDKEYTLFDARLGVGAPFGSGEETDYVLDLLDNGFKGMYFSDSYVYHPVKKQVKSKEKYDRDYKYGLGFGALCKKEISYRKNKKFKKVMLYKLARNIGGILFGSDRDYHIATIKGRIKGYRKF